MCTLIALQGVWEDAPLVVAVNRDEAYDRPSSPPAWSAVPRAGARRILMPRDERAGGTWMGANDAGVWVGLTNRDGPGIDPARRSRGLLCLDLLLASDGSEVADLVSALEEPYNPFNLVAGDAGGLHLTEYAEGRANTRWLGPGCHLVTNRPFDEAEAEPKARRARARLEAAGIWPRPRLGGAAPPRLDRRLATILGDHGAEGQDALCLHGGRHGTRSAAVWRIVPPSARGGSSAVRAGTAGIDLLYADGPPCSVRFERVAARRRGSTERRMIGRVGERRATSTNPAAR